MNSFFRTPVLTTRTISAGSRRYLAACGLALLFFAGGCSQAPAPDANPAGSTQGKSAPAGSTPGSWMDVLQRWWKAASQPESKTGNTVSATKPAPQPSAPTQKEIAVLAARHPAWKLADALEQNRAQTLDFEPVRGSSALNGSTLAAPGFDVNLSGSRSAFDSGSSESDGGDRSTLPRPALAQPDATGSGEVIPGENTGEAEADAPGTIVANLGDWQDAAREQQEDSITGFLRAVSTRQSDWQRDYREILQIVLREDINAAAERIPSALALIMPSPEMQLEMTNLRLQLLSNVFSTPEEREAARERLRVLMAQWREALHEQEVARAEELKRLRIEEPERLRSSGATRIAEELELIQRTQQENIAAVAAEHRAQIAEDFGAEQARLILNIPALTGAPEIGAPAGGSPSYPAAPGTGVLQPGTLQARGETFTDNENSMIPVVGKLVFMRTNRRAMSSVTGFAGVPSSTTTVRNARAEQIRALRALAWRDAKRQAEMARRLGY